MSYLDTTLSEDMWTGWYLSKDSRSIARLTRSELDTLCPKKDSVDYRIFCSYSGLPEFSGIHCFPKDGRICELHRDISCETDGFRFGYMMCGLEGIMADCFRRAYIESRKEELDRANRLIERHFF